MSKPQIDNAPGESKVKVADRTERVARWLLESEFLGTFHGHNHVDVRDRVEARRNATDLLALIDGEQPVVAWEIRRTVDGEQKREVTTHYPGTARFLQSAGLVDPEVRPLTYKEADHGQD